MESNYDYILAGSGLAGLSLLNALLRDDILQHKKILVVDNVKKDLNDKTWCFWEKQAGPFEHLVAKEWKTLQFFSPTVSKTFKMKEYSYKMIQSGDFYNHVIDHAAQFSNVTFLIANILSIEESGDEVFVQTDHGRFLADFIFNSTGLFYPQMSEANTLLQHFMGWFIKVEEKVFDSNVGTLMDFTLSQEYGTTFMYVLPFSDNEALVEYTLFSERVLDQSAYEKELRDYIENKLGLDNYQIEHREFGVIPMTMAKFPRSIGSQHRIINIGTAGGHTKASSGYTFQFVQSQVNRILNLLRLGKSPLVRLSLREKMFQWYDMVLLDVLLQKKVEGEDLFSSLFEANDPELVLAFLANESGFWEEFKIRDSVPFWPFFSSGIKQLLP
ncbi:lycopene cyclase family protein [Belliella sp. R4-6]|uniref:Lycopene cyclase family protein n=1 Tax=Belliella alkalica TaxID=1730871 RepID=A0ABS9VDU4_9BACT|nr:lycopene cyclase family protein [Belliella alkalica]MCH7414592.1 lycopene cyclase family protein [Belliella alkalica]